MNKKNLALLGGGLIAVCTIGAVVCSSMTIYTSNKVSNRISLIQNDLTTLSKAYVKEEKKAADPQYVTIAGQYPILDTSSLSDAYKNKDNSKLTTPEDRETLKMASDLLAKITTDKMSLYEKELAVHDWMAKNIVYANSTLASVPTGRGATHTPYGVLKYKKAVCVGYATTFKLLMNMIGTECMVEHDNELSHSWNVVKLDDQEWYIVDNYYDSANNTAAKNISHSNFNLTNDFFTQDHIFDTSLYPVASGKKYNYAVQNATGLKDIKELPKLLEHAKKKHVINCYYKLPKNPDCKYISAIISGINIRLQDTGSISANYVQADDNNIILSVSYNYNDNTDSDSEENYPNLTKELNKYFGEYPEY